MSDNDNQPSAESTPQPTSTPQSLTDTYIVSSVEQKSYTPQSLSMTAIDSSDVWASRGTGDSRGRTK